jgi:PAS domain S-box-containing protein
MEKKGIHHRFPFFAAALFLVLLAVIVAGAWYYYQHQEKNFRIKVQDELSAVANLKMEQIVSWRKERLADAEILSTGSMLISGSGLEETIRDRFRRIGPLLVAYKKDFGYYSLIVTDIAGRVLENIGDTTRAPLYVDTAAILQVVSEKKTKVVDFYRCPACGRIHLDVLVPVFAGDTGSAVAGVAVLRRDPSNFLFPLIQSWPTPSKTSETLLLRQEGDSILYLNELRHRKGAALKLRFPLDAKDLPAARVVRGEEGFMEGSDYRGVKVFAVGRHIPDSPWYIIAKVDKEEVLAPLRVVGRSTLFMGGLSIAILISLLVMWWMAYDRTMLLARHREEMAREQAEEGLRESEEKFRNVFDNSSVGKSITSPDGRVNANRAFCEMLGYTKEELAQQNWQNISHPDDIELTQENLRQLQSGEKKSARFIKRYFKKDGSIVWVDVGTVLQRDKNGSPLYFITSVIDITDRKWAEDALRTSEELYHSLFANMLNGFAYCRMEFDHDQPSDFMYLDVNNAFEKLTGLKNVVGRKVSDVIPGFRESDFALLEKYGRVAKTGAPEIFETFVSSMNMWFSISVYCPKRDHFVAVFDVITERKRTEKALQENEAKYRNLFENAQVGMFRTKMDGSAILEVNRKLLDTFGFTREEMLASPSTMRWAHPEEREEMARLLRAEGVVTNLEAAFVTKRGETRDFLISVKPYPEQGILEGSGLDITDRIKAEEALQESERRLSEAQKMAQLGNWDWDIKTGKVEWSDEVYHIFQLDPKNFTPRIDSILAFSPWPEDHERDKELIRKAMESREKGNYEQRFLRPDKSIGYYQSTFQGKYDNEGNLISIVGTILDITDRKRTEQEIVRLNNDLLQKNAELEQLVFVASHDLRSPLVNVQGFSKEMGILVNELTSITSNAGLSDKQQSRLSDIVTKEFPEAQNYVLASVIKMDMLLKGLLKLSRLGRAAVILQEINMDDMISDITKTLEFQIQHCGARVELSALPSCIGDPVQVNQVFTNLIDNAIKFLSPDRAGIIRIFGKSLNGMCEYCVEDNGIGIAPEHQLKAFEIFHRLNPQASEGDGLGLAIVKKVLSRLNGNVRLESEAGKGSRFFVSLPGA